MAISKPIFPPRRGYMEVELGGVRRHLPVSDVVAPTVPDQADDGPTEAEDTAAMLIDHEYRLTLMELGLSEGGEM